MENFKFDYTEQTYHKVGDVLRNLEATEYKLLYGHDITAFQELVGSYLLDGWRCQGGICITSVTEDGQTIPAFFQAVVRFTEDDVEDDAE